MKLLRKWYCLLLLMAVPVFFSACRKNDFPDSGAYKRSGLDGIWLSEGYGYLLDIQNGRARFYHLTKDYGIRSNVFFDGASDDVSTWDVVLTDKGKQFIYRGKNVLTHYRFNRINKLPKSVEGGGLPASQDPRLNFDVLWQTFDEHYAFFRQREVNWDAVRTQLRAQVNTNNLQHIIEQALGTFNEDHVTLSPTSDDFLSRFDAGIFRTLGHFAKELPAGTSQQELKLYAIGEYEKIVGNILSNYVSDFHVALNNQLIWGKLDNRTAYLLVGQMQGYELSDLRTALDEALPYLAGFDQLVIDLRGNLGGSDRVALELAGRFTNHPLVGWRFNARDGNKQTPPQTVMVQPTGNTRFTKPIRILTSIATASAAECFTLALKQLPYVRTAGETTNGIFSSILNKQLPNGWVFSLSNETLTDAQGRTYEGKGIAADISAPFPTAAFRNKGIDPALEAYPSWFD